MKKYFLMLLLLLLIKPTNGQGEAALPFLYFQQSPLLIGAGQIGAAIPMKDATGFYYNPAQLGYFSHENNLSIFFMPQETKLYPDFKLDLTFRSFGLSAGYNFKKNTNDLPLSIGVGYLHNKFSYGEFVRTGPDSPDPIGTYESYDAFDCFSVGVGYDYFCLFNIGFAIKSYTSHLLSTAQEGGNASGTAFDFGAMIITPISRLLFNDYKLRLDEESFFKPKFDFTLGYSLTNVGKKITYSDPAQADPIPRTARLGYSLNFTMELFTKGEKLNLLDYSFTAEADDILIKKSIDGSIPEYENILGNINPGKHLIALKADQNVVVHRGHIFRIFESVILASGRYQGRGFYDNRKSNGYGLSSEGLFKLYSKFSDDPIIDYIANHFVLEYYNTNNFVNSFLETNFKGLVLNFKGVEL